jgi:adenylate cyclase
MLVLNPRWFALPIIVMSLMTTLIKTDNSTVPLTAARSTQPAPPAQNNRAEFDRLLHHWRAADAQHRPPIEAEIRQTFAQPLAVLILDTAGFSKTTMQTGIISTLATIQTMNEATLPIVAHHGKLVKFEADNVFAVFPDARSAVQAAIDIFQRLQADNIQVGIGIGYGETLLIEEGNYYANDLYGEQVNLAAKLGEDMAAADELLLTEAAFNQIQPPFGNWKKLDLAVSGLQLPAYRLER